MSLYNGTLFINFWPPIHPFQSFQKSFYLCPQNFSVAYSSYTILLLLIFYRSFILHVRGVESQDFPVDI